MFNLDFETEELQFPCHSRNQSAAERITKELSSSGLSNHFLVFSSGTTSSDLKGYALSKEALFANARAVNDHFGLNSNDVWGLSIPYFHVGGLSVLARAHILKSKPIDLGKWHPLEWIKKVPDVTVTTVVPAQIFDLVQQNLKAPANLRYLIVGGDYLSLELEKRAIDLGWPVIRTFGMTEVCSQLASAKAPWGPLELLPLHEVRLLEGRLLVKGPSLFTLQFKLKDKLEVDYTRDLLDPDGFYPTSDLAELRGNLIVPLGRVDDQIKISGRLVSMNSLREKLYDYAIKNGIYGKAELKLEDNARLGKELIVLHLEEVPAPPAGLFEPLRFKTRAVVSFERTDLGKLKTN